MPASPRALLLAACVVAGEPLAQPADPSLPPAGRSLFDFLVSAEDQRVPFPFDALLRRVGERVHGGTQTGVRAVLIPQGRSLLRHAAGEEPFTYPRVVAAVVGEPAPAAGNAAMQLKDRLYLAYHEKAGILEIISYNEAAGRFEFQVVEDYREGGQPRLRYANRRLCLSCHQNAAPIFSRPPWDETNVNPRVRRGLRAQKRDYYGIAVDLGADAPGAIDSATNQANRFESVQRLWREGCEAPARPDVSVRCRAEAFAAALKYRLSGDRQIDSGARGYHEDFAPVLTEVWRARWPRGIAIPSPDLPNREPRAPIAGELDPLAPRKPIDLRFGTRREDLEHFVGNLAEFMTESDVLALDRWLHETHARVNGAMQSLRMPCRMRERARGLPAQIEFACSAPVTVTPEITVAGRLQVKGARMVSGTIDRFTAPRRTVRDIPVLPAGIAQGADGAEVELALRPDALELRPVDGRSVARVTLRWRAAQRPARGDMTTGDADIWLRDDFAPVARAIDEMMRDTLAGRSDLLAAQPFRRAALVQALFARLGMPARRWCCLDGAGLPPAAVSETRSAPIPAELEAFHRACAGCHAGRQSFPPGFLHGSAEETRRYVDGCAERMFYRISMWRLPDEQRPKSPMPPDAAGFVTSPELPEMTRYLSGRIRAGVLAARYDDLRPCAPAAQSSSAGR